MFTWAVIGYCGMAFVLLDLKSIHKVYSANHYALIIVYSGIFLFIIMFKGFLRDLKDKYEKTKKE
jgi:hypothetical protein